MQHHHKSSLNDKVENQIYESEKESLKNDNFVRQLNESKDEKRNSDVTNMTSSGLQYEEDSEEKIEEEENNEWRLPRDNWKKVAWLKPLTSSSSSSSVDLATLHFIIVLMSAHWLKSCYTDFITVNV